MRHPNAESQALQQSSSGKNIVTTQDRRWRKGQGHQLTQCAGALGEIVRTFNDVIVPNIYASFVESGDEAIHAVLGPIVISNNAADNSDPPMAYLCQMAGDPHATGLVIPAHRRPLPLRVIHAHQDQRDLLPSYLIEYFVLVCLSDEYERVHSPFDQSPNALKFTGERIFVSCYEENESMPFQALL